MNGLVAVLALLRGTRGGDLIRAYAGADSVRALGGPDAVRGGPGADVVEGGAGANRPYSGPGRNTVRGGPGIDTIEVRRRGTGCDPRTSAALLRPALAPGPSARPRSVNREQLAHVLRACDIGRDPSIVVVGSQAILGSYDEDELPRAATASMEVSVAFLDDPDEVKADAVDGAIGELSQFHQTYGLRRPGSDSRARGAAAGLAHASGAVVDSVHRCCECHLPRSTRPRGVQAGGWPGEGPRVRAGPRQRRARHLAVLAERVAELEGIDARVVQRIRDALHSFRGLTLEAGPAPGRSGLPMPD